MDNGKNDLEVVEREGAEIGIHLNKGKSEIICANPEISDPIVHCLSGAKIVDLRVLVSDALTTKVKQLERIGGKAPTPFST